MTTPSQCWIGALLIALIASAQANEPAEFTKREVVLQPGLNAIALTLFQPQQQGPANDAGQGIVEELTANSIFGKVNEVGLMAGQADSADLILVANSTRGQFSEWERLFYFPGDPFFGVNSNPGWYAIGKAGDFGEFPWHYTTGVMINNASNTSRVITFSGVPKSTDTEYAVPTGLSYFNRVYERAVRLSELKLESFFIRLRQPLGPLAGGELSQADQFENLQTRQILFLNTADEWVDGATGGIINPDKYEVPGSFGILRVEKEARFVIPCDGPEIIVNPDNPGVPDEPVDPNTPPTPPTDPLDPDNPDNPDNPTIPGGPDNPDDPVNDGDPNDPGDDNPDDTGNEPAPPDPTVTPFIVSPNLGFQEGAVRRLANVDAKERENVCLFLVHEDRPITLHSAATNNRGVFVRVGKHPFNVVTDAIGFVRGQGRIGPLDFADPSIELVREVRSFLSEQPIPELHPYRARLKDPVWREGERRFFSNLTREGTLRLALDPAFSWAPNTHVEIDLIIATPDNRKVALHIPSVRFREGGEASDCVKILAALLRNALIQRELVPAANLSIEVTDDLELLVSFGRPINFGKLDLCVQAPPKRPTITGTSTTAFQDGLLRITGRDFGRRMEDLCLVLAPANPDRPFETIPLRPVSVNEAGTEIYAKVVGRIKDGNLLRVMVNRGIGRRQPVGLAVSDVIQQEPIWIWRNVGLAATSAPNTVRPALGAGDETLHGATLVGGVLKVTINGAWPENARVRIAFTANTDTVQLDSYAPYLCFTINGTAVDCAARIKNAIESAFIQGGMANNNQVNVQLNVDGDAVTLSASVLSNQGVLDPINSGHLDIYVSESEVDCEPLESEDTDGDLVQDGWETGNFGLLPPEVSPLLDPDDDGVSNNIEFALATDPRSKNNVSPLSIELDDDGQPVLTYRRHVAAANYYAFEIQTSPDGAAWQGLPGMDLLSIVSVGNDAETVVARSLVGIENLSSALFRVNVTPRP